jgi:hypothetical protein
MGNSSSDETVLAGSLFFNAAFDWGDEIDLARAAALAPSQEQDLGRRPRTPASIGYRPAPLRFPLPEVVVRIGDADVRAQAEASVFDFGGVNVRLEIPLGQAAEELRRFAGDPTLQATLIAAARSAVQNLHERLRPTVKGPACSELIEEYFVFRFDPSNWSSVESVTTAHADWLAGLLRLEAGPLAAEQVNEALSRRISYSPQDLVVVDWAAAVVIDHDCAETLRALEFANLQLLEFRLIDRRLDEALDKAYGLIHSLAKRRLLFFGRTQDRPLRVLGDIKLEMEALFDRAAGALKLVGDQYLARVYHLASTRLHLDEWSAGIKSSLETVQDVYQILSDQAAAGRIELLEIIVIVLIAVEIVISLVGH